MILHSVETVHPSRSDVFTLYPIGDIHIGAKGCEVDTLREVVAEVERQPNAFWIGMGDYAESINLSDKRFDLRSIAPRYLPRLDDMPRACLDDLVQLFDPIKKKCLGLLVGNHEEKLRLRDSNDIHGALCVALGVKNLGYDSLLRWTFRRSGASTVVKIMASHGTIASRKAGAAANRMEDVASNFDCDIALFGHGHKKIVGERVELGMPESGAMRITERKKLVLMTGTFRRNHQEGTLDYGEKAGYPPVPIGCPAIRIAPWAPARSRFQVTI